MKQILLVIIVPSLLLADFSLRYKLDKHITQEVNYKDSNHVLFTFLEDNKTFEKLLINKNEKYLTLFKNGIESIYQIDDNISKPINSEDQKYQPNFIILKKDANKTFNNIPAQEWIINDEGVKKKVIVTKQIEIADAIHNTINALQKLLPKEKQQSAYIFDMGNGYVPLKKDNLEFLKFNNKKLSLSLFAIENRLTKEEKEEFSKEINRCFVSVCCGQPHSDNNTITHWLSKKVNKWTLAESATCKNNKNPLNRFQSALYKNSDKTVIIEMTNKNSSQVYGKIESLQAQGVSFDKIENIEISGFKAQKAYLSYIDSTIIDIDLPSRTFSIYQKGKQGLVPFVKQAIDFSKTTKVLSNNTIHN